MGRWMWVVLACSLAAPIWVLDAAVGPLTIASAASKKKAAASTKTTPVAKEETPPDPKVDIISLPDTPDERYDLTWTLTGTAAPAGVLTLDVERAGKTGRGYQLRLENGVASWQQVGVPAPPPAVKTPLALSAGKSYAFSLKRRPDTMALLCDHRLVFYAPAPKLGEGATTAFTRVQAGWTLGEARYRKMARPLFGDDFMRLDSARHMPTAAQPWAEDDTWKVAYYRKDWPINDPRDPKTNTPMTTPWQLSVFPVVQTSTNGFWYAYRGTGPSWVVANANMIYPTWDQYFMEAAVKPEYDSTVGIIAAYQDNKNYLIFRWKQREYVASNATHAELVAVVNGVEHVLDSSPRGFEPNQWYRVRINLGWRQVQALVDDEVLLSADNPGPVEGRVGLFANGAEAPRRLKMDEMTTNMYVMTDEKTGHTINEAADAMRTTSMVLFDDVRVGEWVSMPAAFERTPFAVDTTGKWKTVDDALLPQGNARLLTGSGSWSRYSAATRVRVGHDGTVGVLFHQDAQNSGYLWTLSTYGQKLESVENGVPKQEVDRSTSGLHEDEWADLRVEADGPHVTLYFNSQRVLENYDPQRTHGRCGFLATSDKAAYTPLAITQLDAPRKHRAINETFEKDRWLVTWASAEADWYPSFKPKAYVTPAGAPHEAVGAAAPLPTDQPGTYWHKGGHYHDVTVTVPATAKTLTGQTLHLAANYDADGGYRMQFSAQDNTGKVQFTRGAETVGDYTFPLSTKMQFVFQRLGDFLVLRAQEVDPDDTAVSPEVLRERLVFAYRDRTPLKTEMIGFTVTSPALPAAQVLVQSDRVEDTFEESPVGWITESGVWAVMSRYSCQPQWNWFGGFGPYTPSVWTKRRLDGNQTFEAYIGIKMQFDNMPEEYARRYRDMNVTICADGSHLNSGYTVIRAGHPNGKTQTMLLRKGTIVASSTQPEHLLPQQGIGHRRWFATRIEKRGGEIKVFLDNKLAMTYTDPDPIPGGYATLWTLNNGIMVGRVNYSAEKMTVGTPRAAAPLDVQEAFDPLPTPKVTLDETPLTITNFEDGLGDAKERPGITGRIVRERTNDAAHGPNTIAKVINMYPAGDCSVSLVSTERNLETTPMLHFDYSFDPGTQVNLYVRKQGAWFEYLLTGKPAQENGVIMAGRLPAAADGAWHHLEVNLEKTIGDATLKATGKDMFDPTIQEIAIADWSAPSDVRAYGFGNNKGGTVLRLDNIIMVPLVKGAVKVRWRLPEQPEAIWRVGLDASPNGLPGTTTTEGEATVTPTKDQRFFHLQAKDKTGHWGPVVHIPLNLASPDSKTP